MIANASNLNRRTADIIKNSRETGMNLGGDIAFQPRLAVLRAEDQMDEEA